MEVCLRKAIGKKLRFEIFKRDSFTCRYCGAAPSSGKILNIDHVVPVSKGGTNDILNLVTSCFDCNSGKKDRKLDDSSVLVKQTKQAKILSEKIEQLKLMAEWQESLLSIDNQQLKLIEKHINSYLYKANKAISESFLNTEIRKIAYTANKIWWKCNPHFLTKRLLELKNDGFSIDELSVLVSSVKGISAFEDLINKELS